MKRGLIFFFILIILILSISFASASWFGDFFGKITGKASSSEYSCIRSNEPSIGNANGVGGIDNADATVVNQIVAGLIPYPADICCADVNQDGSINAADTSLILQIAAGTATSPDNCRQAEPTVTCLPTITTSSLSNGIAGTSYSATLTATGENYDSFGRYCKPYYWYISGGSLPAGLSLMSNGVISGTPTTAGTYSFIVAAADQYIQQTATKTFSITIDKLISPTCPSGYVCLDSDNPSTTLIFNGVNYEIELISASDTSAIIKVTNIATGVLDMKEVNEEGSKVSNDLYIYVKSADENNLKLSVVIQVSLAPATLTCTDNDKTSEYPDGKNYYIKGAVHLFSKYKNYGSYDFCQSTLVLREQYCKTENEIDEEFYTCPNGCSDGACKPSNITTCTDSDGGKNYYVKGTAQGIIILADGSETLSEPQTDSCLPVSANVFTSVTEYYCNDKYLKSLDKNCPNGCSDGACKPSNITTCTDSDGTIETDEINIGETKKINGLDIMVGFVNKNMWYESVDLYVSYKGGGQNIRDLGHYSNHVNIDVGGISYKITFISALNTSAIIEVNSEKNYYVKGTASGIDRNNMSAIMTDKCSDSNTLIETSCLNDPLYKDYNAIGEKFNCPFGCVDGACISEEKLLNPIGNLWKESPGSNPDIPMGLVIQYGGNSPEIFKFKKQFSLEEKEFIAKQFQIVIFDQGSFGTWLVSKNENYRGYDSYKINANKLRALNPNIKVLNYYGLTKDQIHMPSSALLPENSLLHYKGSVINATTRIPHLESNSYCVDLTNKHYEEFIVNWLPKWLDDLQMDGYLDDWSGFVYPPCKATIDEFPIGVYNNWANSLYYLSRDLKKVMPDKLHFYNAFHMGEEELSNILHNYKMLENADGVLIEDGAIMYNVHDESTQNLYLNRVDQLLNITKNKDKYVIFLINSGSVNGNIYLPMDEALKLERYYLSFYLMLKNSDKMLFNYHVPIEGAPFFSSLVYFKDWDIRIGQPTTDRIEKSSGVFYRLFENGEVWWNNGNSQYTIKFSENHFTLDDLEVQTYDLPAKQGMIFLDYSISKPEQSLFQKIIEWISDLFS